MDTTIFKNIFITFFQRWPTDSEVQAYVASGDPLPYHYVQIKYLYDPKTPFWSSYGYVKQSVADQALQDAVNAAKAQVIADLKPRIDALQKQVADTAIALEKTQQDLAAANKQIQELKSAADLSKARAVDLFKELITRLFPRREVS